MWISSTQHHFTWDTERMRVTRLSWHNMADLHDWSGGNNEAGPNISHRNNDKRVIGTLRCVFERRLYTQIQSNSLVVTFRYSRFSANLFGKTFLRLFAQYGNTVFRFSLFYVKSFIFIIIFNRFWTFYKNHIMIRNYRRKVDSNENTDCIL